MSGYGSYGWSYEQERERERVIALRADLAALRCRAQTLTEVAAGARQAGVVDGVTAPSVAEQPDSASSAELTAAVAASRTALDRAEQQLTAAWDQRYRTLAGAQEYPTLVQPIRRTATEELTQHRAAGPVEPGDSTADVLALAQQLITTIAFRCADAEVAHLQERCRSVGRATTVEQARAALTDLRVRAQLAIERQNAHRRREEGRVRVLALAEGAAEPDRARLRRWIATVPDPTAAEVMAEVTNAVDREGRRLARLAVAEITMSALAELGYQVGEEFVTALATTEPGTAADHAVLLPTPHSAEHGIRLCFDLGRDQLYTTTVRRAGAGSAARRDTEVQAKVCQDWETVKARLSADGCAVTVLREVKPGERPPPEVDAAAWPAPREAALRDEHRGRRVTAHEVNQKRPR